MSKQIKQLEMDSLKKTFQDACDLVVLTASGINAQTDNQLRLGLRKKNIHLQVVKNSLAHRVFDDLGLKNEALWAGSTFIAWGAKSLKELSQELDSLMKKHEQIKVKGAFAERQVITFQQALTMPTREEALARVVGLLLSTAQHLVSLLHSPGARLVGQLKTLAKKTESAGLAANGTAASVS